MHALLIHPEGRAELVFGEFHGDLTQVAVLTQAAISALEQSAACEVVQTRSAQDWVTVLRHGPKAWLRVQHEPGVAVEQVQEWARTLVIPETKPSQPRPKTGSLADALNVQL